MADPLNTLGFLSWGLLGSGEGEGETIYVLDLGVAVAMDDLVIGMEMEPVQALAMEFDAPNINVDTEAINMIIEMEDEIISSETGDLEVGVEVCDG
jgi:hypothetical protein